MGYRDGRLLNGADQCCGPSLGLQTVFTGLECDSLAVDGICNFEVLWEGDERILRRDEWLANADHSIVRPVLTRLSI